MYNHDTVKANELGINPLDIVADGNANTPAPTVVPATNNAAPNVEELLDVDVDDDSVVGLKFSSLLLLGIMVVLGVGKKNGGDNDSSSSSSSSSLSISSIRIVTESLEITFSVSVVVVVVDDDDDEVLSSVISFSSATTTSASSST